MGNTLFCYPDRTLTATLTGGSWVTGLPLNNVKDAIVSKVARSADTSTASTTFDVVLGTPTNDLLGGVYAIRCIGLIGHNLSALARVRVVGYSDAFATNTYDSGYLDIWPDTLTADDILNLTPNWILPLTTAINARYWKFFIEDPLNPDGYVQFGRCWISEAFAPAVGISWGGNLGHLCNDVLSKSLDGVLWAERRPGQRTAAFALNALTGATEKLQAGHLQRRLQGSGELILVPDLTATTQDILLEAFHCNIKEASPLKYPYFGNFEMSGEAVEVSQGSDARVDAHGTAVLFSAPLQQSLTLDRGQGSATFTRASEQWGLNDSNVLTSVSSGNPFITARGILLEPAATNYMLYNKQLDNAVWAKTNTSVLVDYIEAPDGTSSGDKLVASAATGYHYCYQNATMTGPCTFSVYARASQIQSIRLVIGSGNKGRGFDLEAGTTFSMSPNDAPRYGMEPIRTVQGAMWYRCWVSVDEDAAYCRVDLISGGNSSFTGNDVDGAYVWGAQLERGSYPTSPIMTTSATATRAATSLSYPLTGNFFNSAGSAYAEFTPLAHRGIDQEIVGSGATFKMALGVSGPNAFFYDDAVIVPGTTLTLNSQNKLASSWGGSSAQIVANGGAAASGSFDGALNFDALSIGSRPGYYEVLGYIRNVRIYGKALTTAQLQAMTA